MSFLTARLWCVSGGCLTKDFVFVGYLLGLLPLSSETLFLKTKLRSAVDKRLLFSASKIYVYVYLYIYIQLVKADFEEVYKGYGPESICTM